MRNVEFKAELREPSIAREVCRSLGATLIGTMRQVDTYYRITAGRLKRREIWVQGTEPGTPGQSEVEVIFYERPNALGTKVSQFKIYSEAQAQERFGREPLPIWLTVTKSRTLYMLESTRIHLDSVEGLGNFLEFEYLISRDRPLEQAHEYLQELRKAFAMVIGEPVDCSYSDLIAAGMAGGREG